MPVSTNINRLDKNSVITQTEKKSRTTLASGGNTVVEHSPHHPEVKGLSPATATVTGRDVLVNDKTKEFYHTGVWQQN